MKPLTRCVYTPYLRYMTTTQTTITDALGVTIKPGDVVLVTSYGWGVPLYDVGRKVTVTGFTRSGNLKHDAQPASYLHGPVANGRAIRPMLVAVARRDGEAGLEGNRDDIDRCDDCRTLDGLDRWNDLGGGVAILCTPCAEVRFA